MFEHALKILIAEDSLVTSAIMEHQIIRRAPDFIVRVENTLKGTIEEVEVFKPDVVVLDICLKDCCVPEETLGAIPQLKKYGAKVMVTTADTHITKAYAMDFGADDFYPKLFGDSSVSFLKRIMDLCSQSS